MKGLHTLRPLLFSAGMTLLLVMMAGWYLPGRVIFNYTDSLPHGVYLIRDIRTCEHGDVVVFPVPQHVRKMVQDRGWLNKGEMLMKPVLARSGEECCMRDGLLVINGRTVSRISATDADGRSMPVTEFCGTVPDGMIIVGTAMENSFDSRYFGPVAVSSVTGKAVALLTWESGRQDRQGSHGNEQEAS